ncbi:replication-relaxation family protein [Candidatus Nanosyncoccus alces]|uniref:Replication-relaxation n=1 Tax=Candidatus Nanosyncoccus alces TaxID=2171997 RepID=A0ABY0FPP1_9BACT|nr:replication-relaxation family protein [Candidatus Nanosyncoccus alces]RYC74830.1 hypothetical protein G3RUM_00379 [Candidatus Nanosyncoccus alces]
MKPNNNNGENQAFISVSTASNRPSNRLDFKGAVMAEDGADKQYKGDDSIPFQGIPPNSAAGAAPDKKRRLTRAQLEKLEKRLSARDLSVLQALRKYRFLTSDQVGRLYFTNCSTKTSRTRNQNLLLKRLSDHGLIRPLARRIGGYQGGSSVQIWYLTEAGFRLLTLNTPGEHKRKRFSEPSPMFLEHTLSIAECVVQLTLICRNSHDLSLDAVDTEPSCWRKYKSDGRVCYLKPDVFVVTSYEKYEDSWFIEIDLSTESSSQIIEKCNAYLEYFYTGIEQKETGVFPIVTWVVKDSTRKEKIKQCIRESIKGQPKMFLVITPDELEKMIRQYIDSGEIC